MPLKGGRGDVIRKLRQNKCSVEQVIDVTQSVRQQDESSYSSSGSTQKENKGN